ncbi:MAG: amidase [Sterolibacterium sp.]
MSQPIPNELTLVEAAARLRSGDISAESLTQHSLEKIERSAARLNCFIRLEADAALEQARTLDRDRAQGRLHGPLHGIPLAHKDMFYRAGQITTCGSKIRQDFRPATTATLLARLDAAGAIDLGRLHMAEFALSPTGFNFHLDHCRNPWHPEHVTGGSSSGSGAAVAARMVFGALGSDTGGSVRIPSAACGVTGIKPTQHLLSNHGVMPLSPSQDCMGFLAQTVADCAALFDAVSGSDPADPACCVRPAENYSAQLQTRKEQRFKIAVPAFEASAQLTEEVALTLQTTARTLADCGCELKTVAVPMMDELNTLSTLLLGAEAASLHGPWLRTRPADYSPQVLRRISRGKTYPATAYVDALRLRPLMLEEFIQRHLADADALLLPVLPRAVPTIEETTTGSELTIERVIGRLAYWTRGINYLGLPSLALPAGFSASGLPIGVQLVGHPFAEASLFQIGHGFQQRSDWHCRRPQL